MKSLSLRRSLIVVVSLLISAGMIRLLMAERWMIPTPEVVEKSTRLVRAVYGEELAAAKSRTEKAALARKLLVDANNQDSVSDR